jgi:heme o synthase
MLRICLELAKSGIVFLVLFTAIAGYAAGVSGEHPWSWVTAVLLLLGTALVSGGSAALNQVQESPIDIKMDRTKDRPIPSGRMTRKTALILSVLWIALGSIILAAINSAVLFVGLAAVVFYNVLYTLWWKPRMAFGAVPGAIPGALPIWMGYLAANPDLLAPQGLYLFSILFFWQMPHFWVLAIKYADDYTKGGFPILPAVHGVPVTKTHITLWSLAYVGLGMMGGLFFPVGAISLGISLCVGGWILWELFKFLKSSDSKHWLRFFLAVNFSLMIYLAGIVVDLWSIHLYPTS